jgi:hypothetical protein
MWEINLKFQKIMNNKPVKINQKTISNAILLRPKIYWEIGAMTPFVCPQIRKPLPLDVLRR